MFSKILGKKTKDTNEETQQKKELLEKISKMKLTEMRSYVNNKFTGLPICEDGLIAVLKRIVLPDENTKKLYLQEDDMDTKKRKAFELVLIIAKSQKISFEAVDLMQKFLETYASLIQKYDKEHKEIYLSRLSDAIELALKNIQQISSLKAKMNILGED
jgi:bifunctional DNase/RNase